MRRLQTLRGFSLSEAAPQSQKGQNGQNILQAGNLGIRFLETVSLWINPQRRYHDESECKSECNISKS